MNGRNEGQGRWGHFGTGGLVSGLVLATALGVLAASTTPAEAQDLGPESPDNRRVSLEARGGVNVPTFDIADAARSGPSFGLGLGVAVTPRVWLMADGDFGFHGGEAGGPDVNVYHYVGKVGYEVLDPRAGPWSLMLNAGAGAMTFDVDAPGAGSNTYFAINVGAKLGYAVTERLELLLSPQGDIAFSDEDVLGTDDAWVWPVSAGVRFRF